MEDIKAIKKRIKDAEDYLHTCAMLYAEGAVYSESGYYYKDVIECIKIASGIKQIEQGK